jgi:hypothetical protein
LIEAAVPEYSEYVPTSAVLALTTFHAPLCPLVGSYPAGAPLQSV